MRLHVAKGEPSGSTATLQAWFAYAYAYPSTTASPSLRPPSHQAPRW
jgi:hypothetical protein